jgi:hypothetical protein
MRSSLRRFYGSRCSFNESEIGKTRQCLMGESHNKENTDASYPQSLPNKMHVLCFKQK